MLLWQMLTEEFEKDVNCTAGVSASWPAEPNKLQVSCCTLVDLLLEHI